MSYYNYHATAKRLIREGKLIRWFLADRYHTIAPALVLVFDDVRHPVMPIREYRWEEYRPLLQEVAQRETLTRGSPPSPQDTPGSSR